MSLTFHRTFGIIATAIVLLAVVWGFWIVGSPGQERLRKFDDERVSQLQSINNEILNIAFNSEGLDMKNPVLKHPLPQTLVDVVSQARYSRPIIVDPATGTQYGYTVMTPTTYQLCANFSLPHTKVYDIFWDHPAGHYCYSFDALQQNGYTMPKGAVPAPAIPIR